MKTITTTALLILGLTSSAAQASHRRSLRELAYQLKHQSAEICDDVTDHFRFAPEYRSLSHYARDVYERAEHLYRSTSQRAGLNHIERDAYKLAHEIDELERLVRTMQSHRLRTRVRRLSHGRIEYRIGHRYYSRYQLHELAESIDTMEHTLGELRSLVKSLRYARQRVRHASPVVTTHATPVRYYRRNRFSFSLRIR